MVKRGVAEKVVPPLIWAEDFFSWLYGMSTTPWWRLKLPYVATVRKLVYIIHPLENKPTSNHGRIKRSWASRPGDVGQLLDRAILGQGGQFWTKNIFSQCIWPTNYRNIFGRHPLHVPVATFELDNSNHWIKTFCLFFCWPSRASNNQATVCFVCRNVGPL